MKKNILFLVIGFILASGISAVAYSYTAKQVGFTPSDKTWKVKTVDEALTDLRDSISSLSDYKHITTVYGGKNNTSVSTTTSLTCNVTESGTYLVYISSATNDNSYAKNEGRWGDAISGCTSSNVFIPSFTNAYDDTNVGAYANIQMLYYECRMDSAGTIKYTWTNTNDGNLVMSVFKLSR